MVVGRIELPPSPTRALRRGVVFIAIAVVLLVLGSIGVVLLLVDDVRDDPESLEDIVTAISRESKALTDLYFYVAEASAEITTGAVALADGSLNDPAVLTTLQQVVSTHTNVNGAFVGLPDGGFLYVTRSLATTDGGFRVKRVENADEVTRLVTERQFDELFQPTGEPVQIADTYDPRTRPWYIGALEQGQGWTDPYRFSSSAEPGITYFRHVFADDGETLAIVGVDLQLTEIREFLEARRPGDHGVAAIVSADSLTITGSNVTESAALLPQLVEASDQAGTAVSVSEISSDSGLQVASVAKVGTHQQWTLTVVASQSDFPQSLALRIESVRRLLPAIGILFSLVVVAIAGGALRRVARLHEAATTDSLTGLLKRSEVRNRFAALLDSSPDERIAAIAIDLGSARAIGDAWSSEVSDTTIQVMAKRLVKRIGDAGFAGRQERSEFLAACTLGSDVDPLAEVTGLVECLIETDESLNAVVLPESVTCGFAVREPGQDLGLVTMLRNTDLALLTARSQRENIVQFDPQMALPSVRDHDQRTRLLSALQRDEFEVHFQPEVRLSDAKIIGAEALLRWRQSDGSFTPAKDFIDDIERLQVMDLLSPLVFKEASLLASRNADPDFTVRINCCADQLTNAWLLTAIAQAHRTTVANWCVEITERTIVSSDDKTLTSLASLTDAGVTLALDDFGTGYSSFAELQNLPITTVKIDRSLIKTLNETDAQTSMASLIYDMADRLSLEVVAEGIETDEQRRSLRAIGCTKGQGWLFGAAVPASDFPVGELTPAASN